MASDFRTRAVEHRQHLLAQLIPSIHRSHLRQVVDLDALVHDVDDQLDKHEFNNFSPDRVSQKLADICRLMSTKSQNSKALFLKEAVIAKYVPMLGLRRVLGVNVEVPVLICRLPRVAGDQEISTECIMMLLFALSRNALCSELPPLDQRVCDEKSSQSSLSPPPSSCSSSSLQEAYREAWEETDSLSDWEAPADASEAPLESPCTPQAEWLHDPALLHTTNRRNLSREYSNLRASKLHLRHDSTTIAVPSEAVAPQHVLQSPEVPLPAFKSQGHHHDHLQEHDAVYMVLKQSGLLSQISTQQLCFTATAVALQCLEVLLVRFCHLKDAQSQIADLKRICASSSQERWCCVGN